MPDELFELREAAGAFERLEEWLAGVEFELALTIRTLAIADGRIHLWVGGGIVWDSHPEIEVEESWVKARPLFEFIGSGVPGVARA